jgi:AcrR family transcriptional regulator
LAIARQVFLERGFRATTLEVAERAGISEGSLFNRFGTKELLFRAAMQQPTSSLPERLLLALQSVEQHQLKDALLALAPALLAIARSELPMVLMSWSNPASCPQEGYADKHRAVKQLALFFEAHMRAGHLRPFDAEILTRVFLGALHSYCVIEITGGASKGMLIPEGMFIRGLVDLILEGVCSRDADAAPATSAQVVRAAPLTPTRDARATPARSPTKRRSGATSKPRSSRPPAQSAPPSARSAAPSSPPARTKLPARSKSKR